MCSAKKANDSGKISRHIFSSKGQFLVNGELNGTLQFKINGKLLPSVIKATDRKKLSSVRLKIFFTLALSPDINSLYFVVMTGTNEVKKQILSPKMNERKSLEIINWRHVSAGWTISRHMYGLREKLSTNGMIVLSYCHLLFMSKIFSLCSSLVNLEYICSN